VDPNAKKKNEKIHHMRFVKRQNNVIENMIRYTNVKMYK